MELIAKKVLKVMMLIFNKLNIFFKKLYDKLDENKKSQTDYIQALRVEPWFKSNGDKTFRLNYNLTENSIVFDLGGYKGDWTSDINNKYGCNVYIFEPYSKFYEYIRNRFSNNSKIKVYPFGLDAKNKKVAITVDKDSSSVFKEGRESEQIELISFYDFFNQNKFSKIDLLKINIEGGEYDLLDGIIKNDIAKYISNIQVQFHDFVTNADERMKSIQQNLIKTHHLTYQFEYVWENWELNQ